MIQLDSVWTRLAPGLTVYYSENYLSMDLGMRAGYRGANILCRYDIIDREHAERVVRDRLKRIQKKIDIALG